MISDEPTMSLDRTVRGSETAADFCRQYVAYLAQLVGRIDSKAIEQVAAVLREARERGRTVFVVGNGGSAATASHWANDMMFGPRAAGAPLLRAICLADSASTTTCLANDRAYADVFSAQLEVLFRPDDVLMAISASGNSPNVLAAVQYARDHQGTTIGLVGFDGGRLAALCDVAIVVPTPGGEYGPVEDIHLMLNHVISSWLAHGWRDGAR